MPETFAAYTGLVHIRAILSPDTVLDEVQNAYRMLVGSEDRCDNLERIAALLAGGYTGSLSSERTDATVQD